MYIIFIIRVIIIRVFKEHADLKVAKDGIQTVYSGLLIGILAKVT